MERVDSGGGGGGGNGVVVLVECSQLWCSASKLQKVFLRIARVTPFFSQLWDLSEWSSRNTPSVSDMSENTVWWCGGLIIIIMSPCPVFTTELQLSFPVGEVA